jgi:RNA-directed DNA polymerase
VVAGRVNYVGSVKGWTDPVYLALAHQLAALDRDFRPRALPPLPTGTIRLFCEGETDWPHLAAAQEFFHANGEFIDLRLEAQQADKWGHDELLKRCERLAESPQLSCCICLFDADSPNILKQAVDPTGWRNWGNGVAAVALAPPPWRKPDERVCIEMLHSEDVLRRETAEGRRIFLSEEFSPKTAQHESGLFNVPYAPKRKDPTLVVDQVWKMGSEESVALSKREFSKRVREGQEPFESVDFEGFRSSFECIEAAARSASLGVRRA